MVASSSSLPLFQLKDAVRLRNVDRKRPLLSTSAELLDFSSLHAKRFRPFPRICTGGRCPPRPRRRKAGGRRAANGLRTEASQASPMGRRRIRALKARKQAKVGPSRERSGAGGVTAPGHLMGGALGDSREIAEAPGRRWQGARDDPDKAEPVGPPTVEGGLRPLAERR